MCGIETQPSHQAAAKKPTLFREITGKLGVRETADSDMKSHIKYALHTAAGES